MTVPRRTTSSSSDEADLISNGTLSHPSVWGRRLHHTKRHYPFKYGVTRTSVETLPGDCLSRKVLFIRIGQLQHKTFSANGVNTRSIQPGGRPTINEAVDEIIDAIESVQAVEAMA